MNAAGRAHAFIRGEILAGRLAPGTMLSENELAASLSMSRTPVRAALSRLQDEGWVAIYPQRGALVRELSERELRESAQIRLALELSGVRSGAEDRRREVTAEMDANLTAQRHALETGDFAAFTRLAMALHRSFVEMAGNVTMLHLYDRLQDQQALSIAQSSARITAFPDRIVLEHRRLLDLARDGDWTGFAAQLADHQARSHGLEA